MYPEWRIYMYKSLQWKILITLTLVLAACGLAEPTPLPISTFTDPDEEFAKAVQQAQNTMYLFRQEFLAPSKPYAQMGLKVRFTSEGRVEDMWTDPIYILDDVYTVRMIEGVVLELGAHPDRLVEVDAEEVVDWMIREQDGTVIGGYTLRLDFERMAPDQQKRYLEVTGYKFE
jgi:uncharacterized protein YegJ (DUF2314 family)